MVKHNRLTYNKLMKNIESQIELKRLILSPDISEFYFTKELPFVRFLYDGTEGRILMSFNVQSDPYDCLIFFHEISKLISSITLIHSYYVDTLGKWYTAEQAYQHYYADLKIILSEDAIEQTFSSVIFDILEMADTKFENKIVKRPTFMIDGKEKAKKYLESMDVSKYEKN